MQVTGRCLCGHITYEAEIDPDRVAICHCTDCQTHSATAYGVVVAVEEERFRLLTGALKFFNKTADSGTIRALAFCPECGTRIYARTVGEGTTFFGLRTGTIHQRDELTPKVQVYCRSARGWVADLSAISRFETMPPADWAAGKRR
jgi:hypothetical protein